MNKIIPLTLLLLLFVVYGQSSAWSRTDDNPDAEQILRLKIRAAKDAGIDTTRRFREELEMYSRDLAIPYLRDKQVDDSLIDVAYCRIGEIIEVNHVFVPRPEKPSERENALSMADSLRILLINNPDFGEKATVTAGDWPYFFEDLTFNTPIGAVSEIKESPYGFHIVRVKSRKRLDNAIVPIDSVREKIRNAIMHDERSAMAITRTIDRWKSQDSGRKDLTFNEAIAEFIRELPGREPDYRDILEDYRTGMMVYEIMDKEVWQRARTDSAGLQEYFVNHRSEFVWDRPHYKGYVVSATNDSIADAAVRYLTETIPHDLNAAHPTSVRKRFGNDVRVDQVIVAQGDNKVVDYLCFGGNRPEDDRWKAYRTAIGKIIIAPECAADIKGPVTEKYQQELEKQWLDSLRAN